MSILSVPGYAGHTSGPNGTVTRVVLHATVSPCIIGGARSVADYFTRSTAGGLAHYVVDPTQIVQCADEAQQTWGAPPNQGSIHVEMCDPQTGNPQRWSDPLHQSMLAIAVPLVRDICVRHGLPLAYVDATQLKAGGRGITTHADVSAAWRQTDHTDPGRDFPLTAFVAAVAAPPAVPGTPPPLPIRATTWETDVLSFVYANGWYLIVAGKIVPLEDTRYVPAGTPHMGTLSDRQHQLLLDGLAGK